MGNLFTRKRVITEELENLIVQMKTYKDDIEKTFESRRMLLWYLTLINFFISTSIVGYVWYNFDDQKMKIVLSIAGFISGILFLWIFRRLVNGFYEWRLNIKKKKLDTLIEKKKNILETVKETETFKVATEILEKYGDTPRELVRPVSQPNSPVIQRKGVPIPMTIQRPQHGAQQELRQRGPPSMGGPPNQTPFRPGEPHSRTIPMSAQMLPRGPPIRPIRPFHQEPQSAVYKMVDYFFSDGPSNRMALICSNCHGHNGMALPQEYEYLAFVCFICKHFNPAKKLRSVPSILPPPPQEEETTSDHEVKEENKMAKTEGEKNDTSDSPAPKSENGTEDEFDVVPSPLADEE